MPRLTQSGCRRASSSSPTCVLSLGLWFCAQIKADVANPSSIPILWLSLHAQSRKRFVSSVSGRADLVPDAAGRCLIFCLPHDLLGSQFGAGLVVFSERHTNRSDFSPSAAATGGRWSRVKVADQSMTPFWVMMRVDLNKWVPNSNYCASLGFERNPEIKTLK